MTIKEFARLCDCNAQTLRYYDRIGLLKPQRVDPWSGYRYYAREQALDFVKIKNLQLAHFSIAEIKVLLTKSNADVYAAFDRKIARHKEQLARILEIQRSYRKEMSAMEKAIQSLSDYIFSLDRDPEILKEFGLQPDDDERIAELVRTYIQTQMQESIHDKDLSLVVGDEVIRGDDAVLQKIEELDKDKTESVILGEENVSEKDMFAPERNTVLWEAQGWQHIYEFLDQIPAFEAEKNYNLMLSLNEQSFRNDLSFGLYMLGVLLLRGWVRTQKLGCQVQKSEDDQNRFVLMERKS